MGKSNFCFKANREGERRCGSEKASRSSGKTPPAAHRYRAKADFCQKGWNRGRGPSLTDRSLFCFPTNQIKKERYDEFSKSDFGPK